MIIDLSALPARLLLQPEEARQLPLPGFLGSGNAWSVAVEGTHGVVEARVRLDPLPRPAPPSSTGTDAPPDPQQAAEILQLLARRRGRAVLHLVLARAFGPRSTLAEHWIEIEVR
ncbi:MAG: hypothetical protein JNJ71_09605 [Rubrivivax sp.]|nr:hypothetical protein [Rubrivivax sp.]